MYDLSGTPRVAPLPQSEWSDEQKEMLGGAPPLNIFATLVRHPKLLKRWRVFGGHILRKSSLPERERELLILRTGYRCRSAYEFHQHTSIGLGAGLTQEEIDRVKEEHGSWGQLDGLLVKAVDELVQEHRMSDDTWAALRGQLSEKQMIDLIFTVGQYTLVSMALNTLGIQIEG